jgi:surface polysaccharide O-acyltransferase-like enzyme
MVSGYLIIRKPNSLKHGYFKRLLKVGIPLLAWSIVYLVIRYLYYGVDYMGNPSNVYNGIRCILTGNVNAHLWFLYAILSLYIAAPVLHSYLKSASRENKIYFLLLWGCACFLYPIISDGLKILFEIKKVSFEFYIVNSSVGFFVAGYFLGHRTISPKICMLCLMSFVLLAIAITWGGFEISVTENMRYYLAQERLRIPLALLFFVVLKYIGETEVYQRYLSARVSRLAPLTFGIYLVHFLVIHAFVGGLFGFKFSIDTFAPWFSIPLMAVMVYTASAVMVWILQKIPFARWILP